MSGAGSTYSRLSDLGFGGNGYDNQINLKDEAALDTALRENMGDVQKFFTTETVTDYGDGATADYSEAEGMADVVQDYTALLLGDFYGTEGALVDHRDNYTKEIDRRKAHRRSGKTGAGGQGSVDTQFVEWKRPSQNQPGDAIFNQAFNYNPRTGDIIIH